VGWAAAVERPRHGELGVARVMHRLHRRLSQHVDAQRIAAAIEAAEAETTGSIHVAVAPHFWGDVHRGARSAFRELQAAYLPHRNGVLFFVVPSRRELVVLGDEGIHQKVGQAYWDQIAGAVSERIKASDLTEGIVHGIQETGRTLAQHYPREGTTEPPSRAPS
jgi:uncharacterized membrane protein